MAKLRFCEEELEGQGGGSIGPGEAILDLIMDSFRDPSQKTLDQVQIGNQAQETYQGRLDRINQRIEQLARLPSLVSTSASRWRITSGFGIRREPFGKQIGYHRGVDVAACRGSEVRATARGTVVYAKTIKTLGQSVRIDHGNGLHTLYGHLMSTAVETGDRVGRGHLIGRLGSSGQSGVDVPQDNRAAMMWYRKAAKLGHPHAQRKLAGFYFEGKGVMQDYRTALEWYRKSAENGDTHAMYSLGQAYAKGEGVGKSTEKARRWFDAASRGGHRRPDANLDHPGT